MNKSFSPRFEKRKSFGVSSKLHFAFQSSLKLLCNSLILREMLATLSIYHLLLFRCRWESMLHSLTSLNKTKKQKSIEDPNKITLQFFLSHQLLFQRQRAFTHFSFLERTTDNCTILSSHFLNNMIMLLLVGTFCYQK